MSDYLWVEDRDQLFISTYNPACCAHYGWEYHRAIAFASYVSGYKLAADLLVDKALEEAKAHHIEVIDTLVYPIIYIYRQFMELSIKNIYINYTHLQREESKAIIKEGHSLIKAWDYIKPFAIEVCVEDEDELRDVAIIEDYIKQFEEVSKDSTEYRYPVNKKNNVILKEDTYLDLSNLKEKMQKFSNFFDGLSGAMDQYFGS
jgi:hypothetical protein